MIEIGVSPSTSTSDPGLKMILIFTNFFSCLALMLSTLPGAVQVIVPSLSVALISTFEPFAFVPANVFIGMSPAMRKAAIIMTRVLIK